MKHLRTYGAIFVVVLGVVSIVVGAVFIAQGLGTKQFIVNGLRAERVTLGIEESAAKNGEVVDTLDEARLPPQRSHSTYETGMARTPTPSKVRLSGQPMFRV